MEATTTVEIFANSNEALFARSVLLKHDRSKILEIYFARLDGRTPEMVSAEEAALYEIELDYIKSFLLGQHPQDSLLHKIFRIMN